MTLAGYGHLIFFGILIPIGAIRARKAIAMRPLPQRRRYFRAALVQVAMFGLLSIAVARVERVPLFPHDLPPRAAVAAGLAFLAIAIPAGWPQWVQAVRERRKVVALYMPTNNEERAMWIAAALLAGFCEEISWRGVQTTLLARVTGNLWIAIAITIVMFSIAHAIQGWNSVVVIAIYSAGFHAIVWLSGSLYVAMVVDFLYDLVAGFSYGYLGKKLGYEIPIDGGAAPPITSSDAF